MKQNTSYTLHDPASMANSYPNLSMGSEVWGLLDPMGGVLMADKCLKTVWAAFQKSGGVIFDNSPVQEIVPFGTDLVKVHLVDGKIFNAKSVVICAGPWTNKILQPLG